MSFQTFQPRAYMVVDASVSLKWALDDEDGVPQAVALRDAAFRDGVQMVAPSLWLYEITNGLVMAVRRGRLALELGAEALDHLLALEVRLADPAARDIYEQALRYEITSYDAAYLALASVLEVPLWTGDRRLYKTVRNTASFVRWIGDYHQES